ncbi:Alcohol dehydrogenase-like [Arachis hypogaea]|nr:Alcohol dehydrogenase-like [Arachis hypogaea]
MSLMEGLGAAWNVANVTKGSTGVIFGLGTVGLSVAQGAKLRGASRIIGVDKNPHKCEKAKAFGFTEVVDASSYQEPIAQVTIPFSVIPSDKGYLLQVSKAKVFIPVAKWSSQILPTHHRLLSCVRRLASVSVTILPPSSQTTQ